MADREGRRQEKARVFQSREVLFGAEPTDYERVGRVAAWFDPYEKLWISADDWYKWQKSW